MIREEVKQIKIGGFTGIPVEIQLLCEKFFPVIEITRKNTTKNIIVENYFEGARFKSNHDVFARIASGIAKSNIRNFSVCEMKYLVKRALLDCACADYYYRFEKEL